MKKKLISLVLLCTLIIGSIPLYGQARALTISYNGKTYSYTGKQLKVTCDGVQLPISQTPGILMGSQGYAMLPYYDVFVKSKIKATKVYSSSTKTLLLKYQSKELKMKLNSRTAYLNGRAVTLPLAPLSVRYEDADTTRILVPSRAVADLLDIRYTWISDKSTVAILSDHGSIDTAPDEPAPSSPTTYIHKKKTYKINPRKVQYEGTDVNLSKHPACVIDKYNMVPYYDLFVKNGPKADRTYSSKTKRITLVSTVAGNKNTLVMTVNSKNATLNGKSITLPRAPIFLRFEKGGTKYIYVPAKAVAPLLGLEYSYSSSSKTMSLKPGLTIRINGKHYAYTRTRVNVVANHKKVATKIPGILHENTTLIPVAATFNEKYGLGVDYKYSNKVATFKRRNNTVVVTADSDIAKVNGVSRRMPVAARRIYLPLSNKTYVMVPGEFVIEALGLTYTYSQGTSYINIKDTEDPMVPTPPNPAPVIKNKITLSRPSSIAKGSIRAIDDYNNRRFIIVVPGDQRSYYNSNKPALSSDLSFSTTYDSSKKETKLYFKSPKIKGYRVTEDDRYIYLTHGTPTELYKNVIVLDAGHGGSDAGATGNGYKEKDFCLSIVKGAKSYFDKNSDYKVYYTRLSDTYPSLSERYNLANEVKADMFISVHINSASAGATGTETLYNPDRNMKSSAGLTCYTLASYTQRYLQKATGFADRGLKKRATSLNNGLAVLNHNNGPAVLAEVGFISNPSEAKKMAANLSRYGKAIYDTVLYAASKYPAKH